MSKEFNRVETGYSCKSQIIVKPRMTGYCTMIVKNLGKNEIPCVLKYNTLETGSRSQLIKRFLENKEKPPYHNLTSGLTRKVLIVQ